MNIQEQYEALLQPSEALVNDMASLKGDIIILGAGGKMGPALAKLAKEAIDRSGVKRNLMAASRFSEEGLEQKLQDEGIKTFAVDLLEDDQLESLPEVPNVLYLAGMKFGTKDNASFTWAMNAYLPGRVARKYRNSKIVAFSTGNVYPLTPVARGGVSEDVKPEPIGEYGQSCLGRERMFEYSSLKYKTPVLLYRLNYANDVSYGVLLEIARNVRDDKPIDLSTGSVNVIWQGDANEIALRCLHHCSAPPKFLNVTGSETLSVRWIAGEFGKLFNKAPHFLNAEESTAFLSNAAECHRLFGYPRVNIKQMIEIIGNWMIQGGKTINKETHFQERQGQF